MNKNNLIIGILVVALVAGGAFFAGMKYQQSKTPARGTGFQMTNGQNFRPGGRGQGQAGFRPVTGDILSVDGNSITVKLADGTSKIVFISEKTAINKAATATKDELKVGIRIAAYGTDNTDGSVSAQNIQLNPMVRPTPTAAPAQ